LSNPNYLLDTDTCIYLRQKRPPEVLRRFERLTPGEAAISTITFGELMYGAHRRKDGGATIAIVEALATALPVLALPPEAGPRYGQLRSALTAAGSIIGSNDLWIAAHALAADLTLVTNNMREFRRIEGLMLENWVGGAD
jgi:tRNA(fMet)-specific endonuclease VapC